MSVYSLSYIKHNVGPKLWSLLEQSPSVKQLSGALEHQWRQSLIGANPGSSS